MGGRGEFDCGSAMQSLDENKSGGLEGLRGESRQIQEDADAKA